MPLAFPDLQSIVRAAELNFYVHPTDPVLMLGITGYSGRFQLTAGLLDDGKFLQLRSINYLTVAADHPHSQVVARALLDINYQYRLVKFAWDRRDGEVAAYADLFVNDSTPTPQQVTHLLFFFFSMLDRNYPRIKAALERGGDPGDLPPAIPQPAAPPDEI